MSYNILAVRSGESEDSSLYPFPGEEPDSVEPRPDDGECLDPLVANELLVSEITSKGSRTLVRVRKMKAAVLITEGRVAVACSKYEKGGGWTPFSMGAIPVAIAANTASKVKAARRRRGKMLVGQVRYVQLASVGFKPASGMMQREQLRLGTFDPTADAARVLALDITLGSGQQPASILAEQIACWAAYRELADGGDQLDDERRRLLESLREPEPLVPQANRFSSYFLIATGTSGLDAALQEA